MNNYFLWAVPTSTIELLRRCMWKVPAIAHIMLALFLLGGMSTAQAAKFNCSITSVSPAAPNEGDVVTFEGIATGGGAPYNFTWDFGDGNSSADPNNPIAEVGTSSVTNVYAAAGTYTVTMTVNGKLNGKKQSTCKIKGQLPTATVEVRSVGGNPPVVTNPGTQTNDEGDTVSLQIGAADDPGDILTYSATGLPANLSINANAGLISGTVATGAVANSPYTVTVDVSDGTNTTPVTFQWVVNAVVNNPAPNVSINSTSQNTADVGVAPNGAPVPEQPFVGNNSYRVMAINDLGMHCGDFDTRIASILPPFQILLAQVIQKGAEPRLLDNTQAEVVYSAASNPDDPILNNPNVFTGVAPDGSVFKTNFWDTVASGAYDPFYPPQVTPLAGAVTVDTGLPVPNVEVLYIGPDGIPGTADDAIGKDKSLPLVDRGTLVATQHAMPGMTAPYLGNSPHIAEEFYNDKPFFLDLPFGYVAEDVSWFEGAGIPLSAFDDFGREAPYPLVRVQANVGGTTVATTDTVLPISGEASCKNCHSADVTDTPHAGSALVNLTNVAGQLDDPALGNLPLNVSIEYATDINILRLHDQKHLTSLESEAPVVCQRCHYTPALDLAHVGPLGADHPDANGRTQLTQSTMSNVMHSHHGSTGLFPAIPAPIQNATGTVTNQAERVAAMEASCYQCHPGTDTQCLRGAMFNGDMLCSDCHGNMAQVGDDFSKDVSPTNVGGFIFTGNYYDPNDSQPRVPWANEPGCGSCHTGDVVNNQAGDAGTIINTRDVDGNVDGIRLRQAYRTGDAKATPIVPGNNRFAENIVPASFNGTPNPGAGNPQLYRVSTGHGGVMCEGCHGATHAEWPNANPMSNDNTTANQLQGHTGTITECTTCHTNTGGLSPDGSLDSLEGPHGMHVVGETDFADGDHEDNINKDACRECHGKNGEGSVLSRTAADRDFRGMEDGGLVARGEPVTCFECHDNEL